MGPKNTLGLGVFLQGVIGFIMSGCYKWLATSENVAAFVVVYGYVNFLIFTSLFWKYLIE